MFRPVRFQRHLSLLLTNTSERSLHMEVRQTLSTEPIAGRELDDGAVSFKTRAFLQKKELFEVLIQEGMREEKQWVGVLLHDSVKVQGEEIIHTIEVSGG